MSVVVLTERLDQPGGGRMLGWEVDGVLVASALVGRDAAGDAELRSVTVIPEARGAGIGRAFVDALAELPSAPRLVAEADQDGAAFYEACGFEVEAAGERDGRPWFRCVRSLDATPDPAVAPSFTLRELEDAIRAAWSAETADDPASWPADNPAKDQCGVTALLVRELLGGEILTANVVLDGTRIERHAWNRLASGLELDLTRSQFQKGEQLATPQTGEPLRVDATSPAYALLSARVRATLGLDAQ